MPTDKTLSNFIINRIPTQEIYNKLKEQGKINENELYLVEDVGNGGVSTIQADWNQTDETAPDYIKNKPIPDISSDDTGKSLQVSETGEWELITPETPDVSGQLGTHNTDTSAHTDIRASIPTKVSQLTNDSKYLTNFTETDPTVPAWAKTPNKPTYTASEVGADDSGTANTLLSNHNINTSAHNDIRILINDLTTRLNTLANSDDTTLDQMAEVVAYIKSNKSLIEGITTGKISVDAIVNDLTTDDTSKVLSAAQGVVLKGLIDTLQSAVNGKATNSDLTNHTDNTNNPHNVTKDQLGLSNVENKSSETIRSELTKANVTNALGYTPPQQDTTYSEVSTSSAGLMSPNDKSKLNDMISLPVVTSSDAGKILRVSDSGEWIAVTVDIPTTESVVNGVLAALPTWTGGSY